MMAQNDKANNRKKSQLGMDISTDTPPQPPPMPRAAKVGHKKSRLGCQRCKTRRVKCDEQKPICGSCARHSAECVYLEVRPQVSPHDSSESGQPRRRQSRVSIRANKSPSPSAELFPRTLTDKEDPEIPESKARRLMELRLQQNALLVVAQSSTDVNHTNDEWLRLWQNVVPKMCLEHDSVLYAQLALSATHLLRSSLEDEALYSARQNYFVLALREQRKACAHINPQNAEAVCLTSILILHTSFAMITERSLDVYVPPIEWLKMGRGAGAVMWKANAAVAPEMPASFKIFMDSYQHVLAEQQTPYTLDQPFAAVFNAICEQELDLTLRDAYRKTLAYICFMQRSIDSGESLYVVTRRLQAFPMVIPSKFIDQVEKQDICALVILAHYFAIAAQVDSEPWWLKGSKNERIAAGEIHAINTILAQTCPALMVAKSPSPRCYGN